MKKILALVIGVSFFIAGVVCASPFLVCDPNAGAVKYVLEVYGVELMEGVCDADGSIRYDMSVYVNTGNHTIRAKVGNLWGWSTYSDPFSFDADTPSPASNVELSN